MNPKNGNASNTRSKSSAGSGAAARRGANNSANVTVESEGELGIDEGAVEDERDERGIELPITVAIVIFKNPV